MAYNTSAPTFAASEVVTATKLNALADGIQAAWTSYTPTPTNLTVGNGSLTGRYQRIGKTVHLRIYFAAGTTSSYSASATTFALPAAVHATGGQDITLALYTGTSVFSGVGFIATSASVVQPLVPTSGTATTLAGMSTATLTSGTTGNLTIQGTIELA